MVSYTSHTYYAAIVEEIIKVKYKPDAELIRGFTLMRELWGVYYEYLGKY